jgi:hypothetical protein
LRMSSGASTPIPVPPSENETIFYNNSTIFF